MTDRSKTGKVVQLYSGDPRRGRGRTVIRPDAPDAPPAPVQPLVSELDVSTLRAPHESPLLSLSGVRRAAGTQVVRGADYMRHRLTGDYSIDEFGFDPHFTDNVWLPALRLVAERWFRVKVTGAEHLPETGPALLVANHAGSVPIDALMVSVAVRDYSPGHRFARILAADMAFGAPGLGAVARRIGATLACEDDAMALLQRGELTAVWPEGFKGIGKLYKDRYKLQRFGRGGFVRTAVRSKSPIIPVSIVGSEEIYPMISDLKPLARVLGLPYIPITPLFPLLGPLGMIPLPSKWHIHFGEPISTAQYDELQADDPMTIFDVTDAVREEIQQTLYRMLRRRGGVYFG